MTVFRVSLSILVAVAWLSGGTTNAFSIHRESCRNYRKTTTNNDDDGGGVVSVVVGDDDDSRRNFLNQIAATVSACVVAGGIVARPSPALAVGGSNKVNAKLRSYGVPDAVVPSGLTPLAEVYGKGRNRDPLLVTFSHPLDWVVVTPSNDVNGEDGTIQAGEYAKGDTATLYVYTDPGSVKNIGAKDKAFFAECIIKAISQKGANVYQNFKVTKVEPAKGGYKNQEYVTVDFKYELLTGAGFEVDRRGVASVTSEGNAVQVLWAASTRQRYAKTEPVLRKIVSSFRCYSEGLNFVNDRVVM